MTGCSPANMEAMRRGLPEVGALVCPRCGDGDCFSGPPGGTSLALTVEDVLGLLRRHGAGRCHGCGAALEPAHPSVRERAERLRADVPDHDAEARPSQAATAEAMDEVRREPRAERAEES